MAEFYSDVERHWNWWEEGHSDREQAALRQIVEEWDNGAPELSEAEFDALVQAQHDRVDQRMEATKQRRTTLVAESYDKDRESTRLQLLRTESDAAFFTHVLEKPASGAQRESAEQRLAESHAKASELREQVGDPEQVVDHHGYLPAERRETNLESHMRCWRHPRVAGVVEDGSATVQGIAGTPMPRSTSGLAMASWSSSQPVGSIPSTAAIVVILPLGSLVGTRKGSGGGRPLGMRHAVNQRVRRTPPQRTQPQQSSP